MSGATALAPASAQEPPRSALPVPQTVEMRPRPLYDPVGAKLGSLIALPRLDLTGAYDDNIFADDRHRVADFVSTISPALDLSSRWSRHQLDTTVVGKIIRYADNPDQDLDAVLANSRGRVDVDRDTWLNLSGTYQHDADLQGALETRLNRLRRAIYDRGLGDIRATKRLGGLYASAAFSYEEFDYASLQDAGLSRSDAVGTVRAGYLFSPRFGGFVQSSYDDREYLLNGPSRNSRIVTNLVGATFDINTIFVGEIAVGYLQETFVSSANPQLTTPAFSGRLVWNVTQLTSLIASAQRTAESTQIPGAFTRELTYAGLEAQHELRANLLLKLDYRYERDEYQGLNLIVDTHTTRLGARYLANPWLWFDAGYTFIRRDSNSLPNDQFNINGYTENVIALTVSGRF